MIYRNSILYFLGILGYILTASSCKKYLDKSPDKSLTTPSVAQDLRAVLDYNRVMNENYPVYGAIASDDYYLTDEDYNVLSPFSSNGVGYYTWGLIDEPTDQTSEWYQNYQRIYYVNVVLDYLNKVELNGMSQNDLEAMKGEALFYRGYTHFLLSQTFALPYNPATADTVLGVPLRLTSDINKKVTRPSLKEDFNQIIEDLNTAGKLLPVTTSTKLRPSRAAAYAALANVYLVMMDYDNAGKMAAAALSLYDELIDFNEIDADQIVPIPVLNKEVIWQADIFSNQTLPNYLSSINRSFYQSFDKRDLRKDVYFDTAASKVEFKGDYNGFYRSALLPVYFGGLAVDELYLIKAESAARLGDLNEAADALNMLAEKRFKKDEFTPYSFSSQKEAITSILDMRKKELCFRGIHRWMDIRRLSQIPGEKITLQRTVLGKTYTLKPGDLHYAFLFPQSVIDNSDMPQNKR